MSPYPPLNVRIATPLLELHGATDELLERLAPAVRAGKAMDDPPPYDDPFWAYEPDPDLRVNAWLRGVWRGRGTVDPDRWRLHFVVMVGGEPVGMQDLIGHEFATFGTVESFSWLSSDVRRRGIGSEMRHAILHLAFEGLGAKEAHSEANADNAGSNGISERLGYERNGGAWATCDGTPVLGQRWRLERRVWETRRRDDIALSGTDECRVALGLNAASA